MVVNVKVNRRSAPLLLSHNRSTLRDADPTTNWEGLVGSLTTQAIVVMLSHV